MLQLLIVGINNDVNADTGVLMFRSGLTKGIYDSFLRSYHLNKSELDSVPFLFVDPATGSVRLLSSLMSSKERGTEVYALSAGNDGDMEVLSTENH